MDATDVPIDLATPDRETVAVSVIVPVYNVRQYLDECVRSLVSQTLASIEILLVDDGSTDGCGDIVDRYAAEHPGRIKAFHKPNGGLSDARNFGLGHAKGEYVGFVDSDDWVEPNMFELMFNRAKATDSDVVVCGGTKHMVETGAEVDLLVRGDLNVFGHSVRKAPQVLFASHSLAWNKLYRGRLFANGNNRFPVGQWFEDSAVVYKILSEANRVDCVPERLYHYRFGRPGAITTAVSQKMFDIFLSCDAILAQFPDRRDNPALDQVIEKIVRNHLIARFDLLLASRSRRTAFRYVNRTFDYLDANFPDWRRRYPLGRSRGLSLHGRARRSRLFAYLAILLPGNLTSAGGRVLRGARETAKAGLTAWRARGAENKKRAAQAVLQQHGYRAIGAIIGALNEIGITAFADFGTLLGFVREGGFMAHDIDLDLGILSGAPSDPDAVRRQLEKAGCTIWRRYSLEGRIVEESYYFDCDQNGTRLKFDLNYYSTDADSSRTWLFYRDPAQKYAVRQRSVVEMRYSPIGPIVVRQFGGLPVPVPANAETLLEEKYGPTWRTPDTGWIYWRSPAATPLALREVYINPGKLSGIPPDRMRALQLEQLRVMDGLEALCRQHGLTYYLSEGTLLGAVRHQGYIPWDDDIDIAMPRQDYDRLLAIPGSAWPVDIRLWSHTTDPGYHLPFSKIVATWPSDYRNTMPPDIDSRFSGPRIDIFPLDQVPPLARKGEAEWRQMRFWRSLLSYKRGVSLPKSLSTRARKLLADLLPYAVIHRRIRTLSTRHNGSPDATMTINWGSSYVPARTCVPSEWYGKPAPLMFEGTERPGPARPDLLLKTIYGDYMTPPPPDKRVNASHYMRYLPESGPGETQGTA